MLAITTLEVIGLALIVLAVREWPLLGCGAA